MKCYDVYGAKHVLPLELAGGDECSNYGEPKGYHTNQCDRPWIWYTCDTPCMIIIKERKRCGSTVTLMLAANKRLARVMSCGFILAGASIRRDKAASK